MTGVQKWTDGSMYCGTFKDDLKHGVGLYRWPNGEVHIHRSLTLIFVSFPCACNPVFANLSVSLYCTICL